MKTFSISIPKPCHEDWNKMTPDAKGAFCASCQKSVYDFSKKTDEEIIEVFEKEEKGKVCGRFTPAQLSRPVVSFSDPTLTSMLAKFAYALLLVFGATLFSGDAFGQEKGIKGEVKMMGKPSFERLIIEEEVEIGDTTHAITPKPITKANTVIRCGLRAVKDVDLTSLGQAIVIEEPITITGDTMYSVIDEPADEVPVDNSEPITGETMEYPMMGMMLMVPADTVQTIVEPVIEEVEPEIFRMGEVAYEEPVDLIDTIPGVELIQPEENIEIISMVAGGVSYVELIEETEAPYPVDNNEGEELTNVIEPIETVLVEEMIPVEEDVIPLEEETDRSGLVSETIVVPPADFAVKVSPNPSRGEITLSYTLASAMPVRIDLYDQSGKMIRNLSNLGNQYAGKYNTMFNIGDLQNGTYTAIMITADRKVSLKIVLTK